MSFGAVRGRVVLLHAFDKAWSENHPAGTCYFTDGARTFGARPFDSAGDAATAPVCSDLVELAARQRAANTLVHAARGEFVGAGGQFLGGGVDRLLVVALHETTQRAQQRIQF